MAARGSDIGGMTDFGRPGGHGKSVRDGLLRSAGERLAWLRRRARLTLLEAADKAGISKTELSRLERDERKITLSHIRHLASAYDVTVSFIAALLEAEGKSASPHAVGGEAFTPVQQDETSKPQRAIPLFDSEFVAKEGLATGHEREIALSGKILASPVAYAIQFDAGYAEPWIPPGGIVIADPSHSVRLYDLVVNTVSWTPTILSVVRLEDGRVAGISGEKLVLGQGSSIPSFHRVLGVIFHPETWGMEVRTFRPVASHVN